MLSRFFRDVKSQEEVSHSWNYRWCLHSIHAVNGQRNLLSAQPTQTEQLSSLLPTVCWSKQCGWQLLITPSPDILEKCVVTLLSVLKQFLSCSQKVVICQNMLLRIDSQNIMCQRGGRPRILSPKTFFRNHLKIVWKLNRECGLVFKNKVLWCLPLQPSRTGI